jgi:hypothetical protein
MIDKLLRPLIPDQLKALCEKLEAQDFDARSLHKIKNVIIELELTRLERFIVQRVYRRVRRIHDMNRVMEEIIIGQTESDINMDINAKLRAAIDNGMAGTTLTAPQSKRVVVRPRATTP